MAANNADDFASRSMSFERLLDAPPELVWKVWTDPKHVLNWWGPNGFTNSNVTMDMSPGGSWRFIMHGPDGRDYKNHIRFIEIVENERLEYAQMGEDDTADIKFHVTLQFEKQGEKTRLKMQMVFKTVEELRHVVEEFGAEEGAHQHLARLADYLANLREVQES